MSWTGNRKKQFRKTLITTYRSLKALQIFLTDELEVSLATITTESGLEAAAYDLIEEAETKQWLDRLYQKFCEVNPQEDQLLDQLAAELKAEAQLERTQNPQNNTRKSEDIARKISEQEIPNIDEVLHQVDLKEAMEVFGRVMNSFEDRPGALLLLVENSRAMAGKLCRDRIRERLQPYKGAPSFRCLHSFRHLSIGPPNGWGVGSELDLFQGLAGYFQVEIASAEPGLALASAIVEKLCCSLRSGTVFLIEIERWDGFEHQDRVLDCFLEQFWRPLAKRLAAPEVQEELAYVKIVAAIDSPSPLECSNLPCYCEPDCFTSDKVLRLPLQPWKEQDIQAWLCQYWQFTRQDARQLSQRIYKQSQGLPRLVCDALEEFLTQYQPLTD